MANNINAANINSEDGLYWILNEAKNLLKTDEYAAKTWLLVGRSLYPKCFTFSFEIYSLEKNSKRVADTSLYLEELLALFCTEKKVWEEVMCILNDVLKDDGDENVKFHKEVFQRLPRAIQAYIMREVLVRMPLLLPDIGQQSRLLLHIIDNYSEELPNQGAYLVDLWLATEARDKEAGLSPVNQFREELVTHVLPKVLDSSDSVPCPQIITWFITALEYYVHLAAQEADNYKDPTTKSDVPSKVLPSDPWHNLRSLGALVGKKITWPGESELVFDSESNMKAKFKALNDTFEESTFDEDKSEVELLKFFSLYLSMFFECLHGYSSHLDPSNATKSCAANQVKASRGLVEISLLEDLDTVEDLRAKKPKLEREENRVESSSSSLPTKTPSSDVVEGFIMTVKIWSYLNGGMFASRLSAVHNHWLVKKIWPWMNQFNVDLMIYEGRYNEGLNFYESTKAVQEKRQDFNKNRLLVQMICCAYRSLSPKAFMKALGNLLFKNSDDLPLVQNKGVISPISLPNQSDPYTFSSHRKEIQLKFITLSNQDVLCYAARTMIGCLWNLWKSQPMSSHSDAIIGHLFVLMQYDVYRNEVQLCEMLEHIRKQGRFSYHLFTGYIIDIILLEEFMFLQSSEGSNVALDILPTSIQTTSRTVTRGVNKDTKEEMKTAIEKQVLRCNENIYNLIKSFLTREVDIILKEFN